MFLLLSDILSLMDDVLYVSATAEEAAYLPKDANLLITGVGLVPAAIKVAKALAEQRPSRVINLGTAGALHDNLHGVFEITQVYQHDFDAAAIEAITGKPCKRVIKLEPYFEHLTTARLASGDSFISDTTTRNELAQHAELCDMEGYAVAAACALFDIPCTLLKQVSDPADESSLSTWAGAVDLGARQLADVLK